MLPSVGASDKWLIIFYSGPLGSQRKPKHLIGVMRNVLKEMVILPIQTCVMPRGMLGVDFGMLGWTINGVFIFC